MLENGMVLEMDRHLKDLESQKLPICPVCGVEDCQTIYIYDGELMGCEYCYEDEMSTMDYWDWFERYGDL